MFFSIESSLSVIPLALQNADCCKNVLVIFLFGFLLWNGLTDSEENESSVLIMMFSPLSLLRMENRSSLKSAEKGWESSFCEGGTFPCLTKFCTGSIWLWCVSVAKWFCGGNCFYFSWLSCSSSWVQERQDISAAERFFPFV